MWSWDVEMWFLKYRWGRSIDDGDVHGRKQEGRGERGGGGKGGAARDAFQVDSTHCIQQTSDNVTPLKVENSLSTFANISWKFVHHLTLGVICHAPQGG